MCKVPIVFPLAVLLSASVLLAASSSSGPPAPLCQVSPAQDALPMAPACKDCTVLIFSPRFGTVCTYADSCRHGANACCEYNCSCGASCDLPGTPASACTLDLPTNCCPGAPVACIRSYCDGPGVRCDACGCGVGCCLYKCGVPDPSCTGFDPIPAGAC
jgi:hypothetical protein